MNNAVFGKTMKNLRNRIHIRLISDGKEFSKWTSRPSYMSHKIFDNDLLATHKTKVTWKLIKPAYTERCTLDLSKLLIYKFYYGFIKNKHGKKSRLLFTDTDMWN